MINWGGEGAGENREREFGLKVLGLSSGHVSAGPLNSSWNNSIISMKPPRGLK